MIASPSSESIWYDAQEGQLDGEGGEELVLDLDQSEEGIPLSEEYSQPQSPSQEFNEDDFEVQSKLNYESSVAAQEPTSLPPQFQRRAILPSPISGDEGSLFTALKKNVGKVSFCHRSMPPASSNLPQDLSNISFPVAFNEPLSLLQRYGGQRLRRCLWTLTDYKFRLCEDMEYTTLLEQAVATADPAERMCYVAAFAVSGFAGTKLRSGRKSLFVAPIESL